MVWFSSSGGDCFLSRLLVLVVRDFGGPNSVLVGENLKSPYPYSVSVACFHARKLEFCGLSMCFSTDFDKIFSFSLSQMESAREYVSNC